MKNYIFIFLLFISKIILSQENPELVITNGHLLNITAIDFHPSGKYIATGAEDQSIKIWDVALKQEFRTLFGHTSAVDQIKYTSDGKYLVSMEHMGHIIFWDALSGKKLHSFKSVNINKPFSLSSNNNTILVYTDNDSISLYEIPSGKILNRAIDSKRNPFCFLQSNKEYVSTNDDNKGVVVYSINGGDPLKEIKYNGNEMLQSNMYYNHKTNVCALFGNSEIVVFDLTKQTVKVKMPFPATDLLKTLSFSNDGKKLVAAGMFNKLIVYDVESGKEILKINEFTRTPDFTKDYAMCQGLNAVAFSPDNKLLVVNGMITESKKKVFTTKYASIIYNIENGKRYGMLEGEFKMVNGLALVNDNKYLCTPILNSTSSGIRFWNLKDGSIIKNIPSYFSAFSKNANKAAAYTPNEGITVFNTTDFEKEKQLKLNFVHKVILSDDGNYLVACLTNTSNPLKDGIQIYETKNYTQIAKYEVDHNSFGINTYSSPDNKYLIGVGRNNLEVKDFKTGKTIPQKKVDYDMNKLLAFVPGTTQALVADNNFEYENSAKLHIIDYLSGEEKGALDLESQNFISNANFSKDGKTLAVGSGVSFGDDFYIKLIDWDSKKIKCTLTGHHNTVDYLSWNNDGSILYSASADGAAKSWDINQCKEKGTFICMTGPEEYIIHSPDYYYKCSKGNYEGICFRYKNKLYRFDQFDIVLNRPDIVMEKLGSPKLLVAMYKQAWKKRIKRLGFTEEMLSGTLSLPEAEVEGKESITQTGGKIKFKLKAKDESSNINRINVFINNVPLYGVKGMDVTSEKTKALTKEINFELSNGKNQIDVCVINDKGLESPKESFQIDYIKPAAAKPDLYIFAVGVSKFKEAKHNLTFPVKDATDFINMMKTDAQFGKVEVVFIQDSMATKENIISSSKILEKSKIDDQVIIYISSHGLLDTKLDYFIATNGVNFEEPSATGLPYEEIENMLNKVSSRNRLVLIDACHSGEVDKEGVEVVSNNGNPDAAKVTVKGGEFSLKPKAGLKNSFAYMQALFSDVSKGSGATIISAAGGNEFALESKEWNNGVFTYSILKGIKSNEADLDNDKQIKISELKFYVIDKVSELTGGKQTPTARKENEVNNFIIYKK